MFNWTAFPEGLDNNYEDLEATAMAASPSPVTSPPAVITSTTTQQQPSVPNPAQMLPRSASTSQIDSTSPTPHFETANTSLFSVTTGSRLHQRTPGVGSLSEASSPMMGSTGRHLSSKGATLDSLAHGVKGQSTLDGAGLGFKGQQQQQQKEQQKSVISMDPPSGCWWLAKKSANLPDFVLISEFSELEGPRAVMTIPDNIVDLTRDSYSSHKQRYQESSGKHSHDHSETSNSTLSPDGSGGQDNDSEDLFDVHEFVLRITSVDQQQRESSGGFHIPEDIEVHVSDVEKGYWAYVHHFTLFDINARGFVRPFCMSYITRDPHKILSQYEEMRQRFRKAALYFKTGNYTLFRQDLTKRLRDLNYTNNLLSESPSDAPGYSESAHSSPPKETLTSTASQNTLTPSSPELSELTEKLEGPGLTEQQKDDLESIKDAIETATLIISTLEHYSIDGEPLLGHADDGHDGPQSMAPLSDLSPMNSSENLAMLAAGRPGAVDPSLFLGATSRSGSRIRHKNSTSSVLSPSRILDASGIMGESLSAPLPHLLGLQQEQSRKNSVVSDYDSIMYETPEYEAQYVTTLYPIFRDEVVFRPLRELCVATMVWNSSIQFHLGIKKIKDILKEFQADAPFLGQAADSLKRMHPTTAALTIGQKFMINFRNPEFNRATVRPTQQEEPPVPLVELLRGISNAGAHSDDGLSVQEAQPVQTPDPSTLVQDDNVAGELRPGQTVYADDADDEQTGYDSLDDAASFFTAATGMATHADTPTREAFVVTPLDRSARVVEWHQEQQTLHHAKDTPAHPEGAKGTPAHPEGAGEQTPWAFGAGVSQGESSMGGNLGRPQHRYSAQSGTSMGLIGAAAIPATSCPTLVLDTLQKDATLAKHLVFALLSGQKVCIMGTSECEQKVRSLVTVLATFLPHTGYPTREEQLMEQQRRIIPWYQGYGLLQVEDMERFFIIGVDSSKIDPKFMEGDICVVDCDTLTWVNGRQYTDGILLESIFRNMALFSEDASFMAFVEVKFFDMLLKSFLYYHLVFQGRLYQGGLLAPPGVNSFYSSGASDDGEAFSYQSNFRSARPSPLTRKSNGLSRGSRRNTSAYLSSTNIGATALNKHSGLANDALSSHDSSDMEKSFSANGQGRRGFRRDLAEGHYYERSSRNQRGRPEFSGDESSQNGGPMQYTTSQGMRKWKKWFDYWSAKSAAMIDPALAAFGRSDSNAHIDGASGSNGRRKRNSSRMSSPRRPRNPSSHHTSPGRNRESKEREKERDRERDKERDRKATYDAYEVTKEKAAAFGSSDSDSFRQRNISEKMAVKDEKERVEYLGDQIDGFNKFQPARVEDDATHTSKLHDSSSTVTKSSSTLRKLKPKRPLSLHRHLGHISDHDRNPSEDAKSITKSDVSAKSPSAASPTPSATFRSLAGTFRAMSFGRSLPSTTMTSPTDPPLETTSQLDTSVKSLGRLSADVQRSPRNSRELSESNHHKDVKRRSSTRAKAKAWFKAKRKRRSRINDGDEHLGVQDGASEHMRDMSEDDHDSTSDDLNEDHGQEDEPSPPQPCDPESEPLGPARPPPKSAPASTISAMTLRALSPMQSQSSVDLTSLSKVSVPPETPLEVPLTLEEIAAQEPTRIIPRPTATTATTANLINSNSSSRVSSANASRITSPTFVSPTAAQHHRRLDSIAGSRQTLKGLGLNNGGTGATETRSELDDSEYDRRRDFGRESGTDYETSLETFGSMDIGSPGFMHSRGSISGPYPSHRQSIESFGRRSLDSPTAASAMVAVANNTTTLAGKGKPPQISVKEMEKLAAAKEKEKKDTVTLTEEEEAVVRDMVGGVSGADDWSIVVYLATMVDEYERSKDPKVPVSGEP